MYDAIVTAAERSGIKLNIEYLLDDPNATAIMVSVKPVVGFASALRDVHAAGVNGYSQTATVALYNPVPTVDLYAVWRADDTRPLVQAFLGCVESAKPVEPSISET